MEKQWANLINFLTYLAISLPLMGVGLWIFMKVTPYKDFQVIGEGGTADPIKAASSIAAAYVLGGKVLALAVVLASAIFHSVNPIDLIIWGIVGIAFQIAIYYIYELTTPLKLLMKFRKVMLL